MQNQLKFRYSIVTRFGVLFIGLLIITVLVAGYLVYSNSSKVISEYSRDRLRNTSELAAQSFYALINQVRNDIALLSENPIIWNYVNTPSDQSRSDLNKLFFSTLENKPDYFQLRLISAEDYGKEMVRFDKYYGKVSQTLSFELQDKSDKPYIRESLSLGRGQFYFSEINLNEEFGVVEIPYTPTVRAASPIFYENGSLMGVVVINVSLNRLYQEFDKLVESGINLFLIDSTDQYIYSNEQKECFNLQLDHNHTFQRDFGQSIVNLKPDENAHIIHNIEGDRIMYYLRKLSYYRNQRELFLMSVIDERKILDNIYKVRNQSLKNLLLICIMVAVVFILFTRVYSNRIIKITRSLIMYNSESRSEELRLPETSHDELGLLARTFNKMQEQINHQLEELNIAIKKEKKAIQEKDNFLQNMSHELRTPLNAILGITYLLQKNNPNSNQIPIIESLQRSAHNLSGLMYDILDLQKLNEGKVTIEMKPTNIYRLLKDIYASYQFEAIKKNLEFTIEVDEELKNKLFITDEKRLGQIVTNLLVNAIKFTNTGSVNLLGKTEYHPELHLIIQIRDTGIGIDKDNIQRINDKFFQEHQEREENNQGFGLGLSIVKHLSELFGGTLKVSSRKGSGSEFTYSMPIVPAEGIEKKITGTPTMRRPILHNKYKIFYLEDDEPSIHLIQHLISHQNLDLVSVSKFNQLADLVNQNTPDLVISDLMLNNENISTRLKDLSNYHEFRLLIISAFDKEQVENISDYFIQKPIHPEILLDLVFVILGRHEYEYPDLNKTYADYDHDESKILHNLDLLIKEFDAYFKRIVKVCNTQDQEEWGAIMHKLIAHIKNLKLNVFSGLLPQNIDEIDEKQIEKIQNFIAYFQCVFRVEKFFLRQ